MLSKEDIAWIKENRKELEQNRTVTLILYHEVEGTEKNPLTGELIKLPPVEEEVEATFRRITSQSAGNNGNGVIMVDGVIAETGNAIANIGVDIELSDVDKVLHVPSERMWRIKARDRVGLGEENRNYVLLERIT